MLQSPSAIKDKVEKAKLGTYTHTIVVSDKSLTILKLSSDRLRQIKDNKGKSLEDLCVLLDDIYKQLSEDEQSIIYLQEKEEFSHFCNNVLNAIAAKYDATSDRYTLFKKTPQRNNQCVEASLLQLIAKLRVPMTAQAYKGTAFAVPCADITTKFIERSVAYFSNPQARAQFNHLTFTLAALANIDINQFKTKMKAATFLDKERVTNPPIDALVNTTLKHINDNLNYWPADALIRALHSIIILSDANKGFKNYLSSDKAKIILDKIEEKLPPLSSKNEKDIYLAQQLFQIRNIYSDVFPAKLSMMIEPFLTIFSENSHGSRFESAVFKTLKQAANELAQTFPDLVDVNGFNPHNPISDALGLESDITYKNSLIKVCIQVDGDKYHCYPGTKTTTQKTLLRDFSFLQDKWQLIHFTDTQQGLEKAKQFLFDAVIVPTYEAQVKKDLLQVQTYNQAKDKLAALFIKIQSYEAKMKMFHQGLIQLGSKIQHAPTHQRAFEALATHYNTLTHAMQSSMAIKPLFDIVNQQLLGFDAKKANELANIAFILKETNISINTLSLELEHLRKSEISLSRNIEECEKKIKDNEEEEVKKEIYSSATSIEERKKLNFSLKQSQKSLASVQENLAKKQKLLKDYQETKVRLENSLRSPVIGAELAKNIAHLLAFEAQYAALSDDISTIDSDLQKLGALSSSIDEEQLQKSFSTLSVQEQQHQQYLQHQAYLHHQALQHQAFMQHQFELHRRQYHHQVRPHEHHPNHGPQQSSSNRSHTAVNLFK